MDKSKRKRTEHLLLPLESKPVQDEDLGRQCDPSHLAVVKSDSQEVQGASPVHGGAGDVERKASDGGIHQDSEVVSKVGAGDAKSIHAGQNENGAKAKEDGSQDRLVHRGVVRLVSQGQLVEVVTQNAQRKDGECEEVASIVGATEYTSQEVIPVLYKMKRPRLYEQLLKTTRTAGCFSSMPAQRCKHGERWSNQPARATMLRNQSQPLRFIDLPDRRLRYILSIFKGLTYFQKIGLKAIDNAVTANGRSS